MDVHISEQSLMVLSASVLLWVCITKGWLSELTIRGVVAKFFDRDKPPPTQR